MQKKLPKTLRKRYLAEFKILYQCPFCKEFLDYDLYNYHRKEWGFEVFSCNKCKKVFALQLQELQPSKEWLWKR